MLTRCQRGADDAHRVAARLAELSTEGRPWARAGVKQVIKRSGGGKAVNLGF